jgi:hypothetical protein
MDTKEFMALLNTLHACKEAKEWALGKDLHSVWTTCKHGDWLLWLCGKMVDKPNWPTRKQLVLAACNCAETSLKYVRTGEDRPRIAIETAKAWVRDEATLEQVKIAAYAAAYATDAAANAAAYAAAYTAYAANAAANAASAAAYAANAAANAVYVVAEYDVNAAAKSSHLLICADIIRQTIPEPLA